jgi:hypothetical protein
LILNASLLRASNDSGGLLVLCLLGLGAAIYFFIKGFRLLERRRLILDTPFSKIRSAPMGMVELSGLAVGPYTMIAPVTARDCYYYRTLVWEWKRQGKSDEWVKVAGECMHVPFFLDDNTGRVLVDPRGADLDLHRDFQEEFCDSFFTTKDPVPDNVRSFLARNGIVTQNKIKVEEFCIKPKNALFILGTLAENPGFELAPQPIREVEALALISTERFSLRRGSTFSFSTHPGGNFNTGSLLQPLAARPLARLDAKDAQVIRLSTEQTPAGSADMTQQQKIAAALLKAGISNPAAWSAAGVASPAIRVREEASVLTVRSQNEVKGFGRAGSGSAVLEPNGFDPHPSVVLMKGASNKTFMISWRSQQDVARALGWKCTLMIWGGPALALLSLYVVLNVEHLL